jgi:hypothetical protein
LSSNRLTKLTFPTKRLTRPSDPTAAGSRLVMSGVADRRSGHQRQARNLGGLPSKCGSWDEGAGGAFAMAAAMTASISAEVGGRASTGVGALSPSKPGKVICPSASTLI